MGIQIRVTVPRKMLGRHQQAVFPVTFQRLQRIRCHRFRRISKTAGTGVSEEKADESLNQCEYRPKVAIVMLLRGVDAVQAQKMLEKCDGQIARVIKEG